MVPAGLPSSKLQYPSRTVIASAGARQPVGGDKASQIGTTPQIKPAAAAKAPKPKAAARVKAKVAKAAKAKRATYRRWQPAEVDLLKKAMADASRKGKKPPFKSLARRLGIAEDKVKLKAKRLARVELLSQVGQYRQYMHAVL